MGYYVVSDCMMMAEFLWLVIEASLDGPSARLHDLLSWLVTAGRLFCSARRLPVKGRIAFPWISGRDRLHSLTHYYYTRPRGGDVARGGLLGGSGSSVVVFLQFFEALGSVSLCVL